MRARPDARSVGRSDGRLHACASSPRGGGSGGNILRLHTARDIEVDGGLWTLLRAPSRRTHPPTHGCEGMRTCATRPPPRSPAASRWNASRERVLAIATSVPTCTACRSGDLERRSTRTLSDAPASCTALCTHAIAGATQHSCHPPPARALYVTVCTARKCALMKAGTKVSALGAALRAVRRQVHCSNAALFHEHRRPPPPFANHTRRPHTIALTTDAREVRTSICAPAVFPIFLRLMRTVRGRLSPSYLELLRSTSPTSCPHIWRLYHGRRFFSPICRVFNLWPPPP